MNLFDMLMKGILPSDKEESSKNPEDKVKKLEEQARLETKNRVEKRLQEALKKSEEEEQNAISRAKSEASTAKAFAEKEQAAIRFIESLERATGKLKWSCQNGNTSHIQGCFNQEPMFDIKRGILHYKMRLISPKNFGENSILHRAKNVNVPTSYSSIDVYGLKQKAERILVNIEKLEREKNEQEKKSRK